MTSLIPAGSAFEREVPAIRSALERVGKLCADSARVLNESMVGCASSSLEGSQARSSGIQGYIRETGQLLSMLRAKLIRFQERRDSRLEAISAIQEKTQVVLRSSSQIEKLGSKLKLLALNARIESALAGKAGVGFNVVATEVGELGEQILELTQRIARESAETVRVLDEGRSVVLAQDEEEAEFSRQTEEQIGRIAADLGRMGPVKGSAVDLSDLTEKASESLGAAVRALQFEDMVAQLLADVSTRMNGLEEAHAGPSAASPEERSVDGCSSVQQTSMDPGSIELF